MGNSTDSGPLGVKRRRFDTSLVPPRTPGTLGRLDAADPDQSAFPGDSPRSLGLRDLGEPKGHYDLVFPLIFEQSEEYQVFESRVLAAHIRRQTRPPAEEIPEAQLVSVEDGYKLRRSAAEQCIALLKQARLDLKSEQEEFARKAKKDQEAEEKKAKSLGEVVPTHVTEIGITSGYRGLKHDTELWHEKFREQFRLHYSELPGYSFVQVRTGSKRRRRVTSICVGPADKMLQFIAHIKAAPGYSNHTNGVAVDFFSEEGGKRFAANTKLRDKALDKYNKLYEKTWFYRWLEKHKDEYGIKREYKGEAWHWDFGTVKGDYPFDRIDRMRRCA